MSAIGSIATNSIDVLGGVTSACSSSGSATPASSDTTAVSGFGQFMSKLQALKSSNPAQAKQVLTDIASKLSAEAKQASGPEADRLNQLAAKFTTAAQTGNLSALQPPAQASGTGGHHHHGHHHAAQQYQNSQDSLLDMMNGVLSSDTGSASTTASAT